MFSCWKGGGAVRCDVWHRKAAKQTNDYFVSTTCTYHGDPLPTRTTPPVQTAVSDVGFLGPRTDRPQGRAVFEGVLLNCCAAGNQYAGWGREDFARRIPNRALFLVRGVRPGISSMENHKADFQHHCI